MILNAMPASLSDQILVYPSRCRTKDFESGEIPPQLLLVAHLGCVWGLFVSILCHILHVLPSAAKQERELTKDGGILIIGVRGRHFGCEFQE